MARTTTDSNSKPEREKHMNVTVPLKESDYRKLSDLASNQYRKISDQARAFILNGMKVNKVH